MSSRHWLFVGLSLLLLGLPALSQQPEDLNEACLTCHDDIHEWLQKSSHSQVFGRTSPSGYTGCQSCHWPGTEHAEDPDNPIFAFREESAKEQSSRCSACHTDPGGRHTTHERAGLTCVSCHNSGHPESPDLKMGMLDQPQLDLCLSCHGEQGIQMDLPYRHRTSDGTLTCSDCHDPHSRPLDRANSVRFDRKCFDCHSDKQGPFVFEHTNNAFIGCQTCHQPHGSTNPQLLIRHKVSFLCLECHMDLPGDHNLSRERFQNCTLCHRAIHGSHVDRNLLR